MRALRRWTRKARCRAKYGKACPHGGHHGGKRRNRKTATLTQTHPRKAGKDMSTPGHNSRKRSIPDVKADA